MNDKNDRAESLGTSGAPTGDAGREPTQKPDGLGEDGTGEATGDEEGDEAEREQHRCGVTGA